MMNALAIFLSYIHARNSTAVCIYTIKMIENIFENSKFKGYNDNVPTPRPGTVRTLLCCYVTLQKQNLQTTSSKLFYFYISIFVLLTCSLSSLFYIMCMSTTCGLKKKKKKRHGNSCVHGLFHHIHCFHHRDCGYLFDIHWD